MTRYLGPGPIRSVEWMDFAERTLKYQRIIIHTDGARSYRFALPGLIHDHVVHMKKPITVKGKRFWVQPFFTKNYTHTMPDGTLKEVLGAQIIDRFWRTLRRSLVGRAFPVGSHSFHRRICSTQWEYWHRGEDQWTATGDLLRANRLADGTKMQLDVV